MDKWDIDRLKEDIKKYSEMRDSLSASVKKMEKAKENADRTLKNIPNEENVWRNRCLQQQEENQKLQAELEAHQRELMNVKKPDEASGEQEEEPPSSSLWPGLKPGRGPGLDKMTDFTLRQLQKKLEKDKTETEWKLKEYGWRLDQASAALSRAEEEKKAILTQIGHAVVKMKDLHKTKSCELTKSCSTTQH